VDATDAPVEITTEFEPCGKAPPAGRYEVNPDRFVLEPAVRVLRWPVLRGRFACTGGHLVLGDNAELAVDLDTRSLRTNIFGLARTLTNEGGLCAAEFPAIRFRSTDLAVADDWSVELVGRLDVSGEVRDIRLSGLLAHVDELAWVLWVRGVLPPPRRPLETGYWISQVIAERPLHIELAAEFER
jgi:polyisoprenoid-binding protein YceI